MSHFLVLPISGFIALLNLSLMDRTRYQRMNHSKSSPIMNMMASIVASPVKGGMVNPGNRNIINDVSTEQMIAASAELISLLSRLISISEEC